MRTKQHNLNPVERTIGATGLFGLVGQQHLSQRGYPHTGTVVPADTARPSQPGDRCMWLDAGLAAGNPGSFGLSAEQPGQTLLS